MPELNTALFTKVRDQIVPNPESHEQADFEAEYAECGVTRCVAGWAILIDAQEKGESITSFRDSLRYQASGRAPSGYAQELLGLTEIEADYLFFEVDNEEAVEIVRGCAAGIRPQFALDEEEL